MLRMYICVYIYSLGDGKTHYIKRQLHGNRSSLVIAVNESFSPLNAISKLRMLPRNKSCNVFFNFTIVPSIVSVYLICQLVKMHLHIGNLLTCHRFL